MKRFGVIVVLSVSLVLGGCQSFQKDHDLELYLVGAALTYAAAKHICRESDFKEHCGVGSAVAFVLWY